MRVTNKHKIPRFKDNANVAYLDADIFFTKEKALIMHSGILPTSGINIPEAILKLYILIAADGSITNTNTKHCRIRIKKSHKIKFIRQTLQQTKLPFTEHKTTDYVTFTFYIPSILFDWNIKGLDRKLLSCNVTQFLHILNAYAHSDGNKNGKGYIIYSAKEQEIDLLQTLSIQCGWAANKSTFNNTSGFSKNSQYQLSIYPKQFICHTNLKSKVIIEHAQNEHFWCIKTPNQNFFMRRNGKIHLTGNCHGSLQASERKRMDVGIDTHPNFEPYSFEEVEAVMNTRTIRAIDHYKVIT